MKTWRYVRPAALVALAVTVFNTSAPLIADDDLRQKALALNSVTGDEPIDGQVRALSTNQTEAKKLLAFALTMSKEKDQPFNFNATYILGQVALRVKEYETSQVFFRLCVEQSAKLGSTRKLLQGLAGLESNISALFADKKYEETAKLCQELLEIFERERISQEFREDILRQWIRALTKGGKGADADKMLENLIKVRGHNWRNVELRAWYYREAGRLDESAKAYEEALALYEKDKDAEAGSEQGWIGRGDRLAKMNMNLGQVYASLKQPDKAAECMKKCAQIYEDLLKRILDSDDLGEGKAGLADEVRYLLSGVYLDLKNVDKCIANLKHLVAAHPDNPTFNNDLGYIMADHDMNLDEAEKLIRKALDEDRKKRDENPNAQPDDGDNASYLDSLGWVLFKKKQYEEAKKYLLKAVEDKQEGQHIEIYDHLGDVYMALGDKPAAIAAWKKGVEVTRDLLREQERKIAVEKKIKEHE
jgi:tetratricopeptide (TPR) repeat protein